MRGYVLELHTSGFGRYEIKFVCGVLSLVLVSRGKVDVSESCHSVHVILQYILDGSVLIWYQLPMYSFPVQFIFHTA